MRGRYLWENKEGVMANAAQWLGLLVLFAGLVQLVLNDASDTQTKDAANTRVPRWEPSVRGAR